MKVKAVNTRQFSLKEFIKLKKYSPFDTYRQQGKQIGLAFLFGRGATSFAIGDLDLSWSEEDADNFIKENRLQNQLESIKEKNSAIKSYNRKQLKLLACANHIRNIFFETYPGLMRRIESNRNFAKQNGYIRSIYGAFRRLPQLYFLSDEDYSKNTAEINNCINISTNADIQNFESVVVNRAIIEIHRWLVENKMKSRLIDQTHDAISLYVHRDEIKKVYKKVKEIMEKYYIEYWKIPLEVEGKHCDLKNGGWYKNGIDWAEYLKD